MLLSSSPSPVKHCSILQKALLVFIFISVCFLSLSLFYLILFLLFFSICLFCLVVFFLTVKVFSGAGCACRILSCFPFSEQTEMGRNEGALIGVYKKNDRRPM